MSFTIHPLKSKTMWGLVLTAPAIVAQIFRAVGHPEWALAVETIGGLFGAHDVSGIIAGPGLGLAAVGRFQASKPLSFSAPLSASKNVSG